MRIHPHPQPHTLPIHPHDPTQLHHTTTTQIYNTTTIQIYNTTIQIQVQALIRVLQQLQVQLLQVIQFLLFLLHLLGSLLAYHDLLYHGGLVYSVVCSVVVVRFCLCCGVVRLKFVFYLLL